MARPAPNIRDVRGLDAVLTDQQGQIDRMSDEDVVIENNRRIMLRSPNGTYWAIVVSDTGGLSTVNMGTTL